MMNELKNKVAFMVAALLLLVSLTAFGQSGEEVTVNDSRIILEEIMKIPAKSIPLALFQKAEGIAMFPGMMKGGFIVGAQWGKGVLVVKNAVGTWEYPRFATLTSGSVGFQVGVQSADVILFFCTRRSVEAALQGRFTVGADANVAAGPIGRQTSAATDWRFTSEIYSYSRSRGVFLGVSIDGSIMEINNGTTTSFYQQGVPAIAKTLLDLIAGYATVPPTEPSLPANPQATGLQ